jgi:hypothetical protein
VEICPFESKVGGASIFEEIISCGAGPVDPRLVIRVRAPINRRTLADLGDEGAAFGASKTCSAGSLPTHSIVVWRDSSSAVDDPPSVLRWPILFCVRSCFELPGSSPFTWISGSWHSSGSHICILDRERVIGDRSSSSGFVVGSVCLVSMVDMDSGFCSFRRNGSSAELMTQLAVFASRGRLAGEPSSMVAFGVELASSSLN